MCTYLYSASGWCRGVSSVRWYEARRSCIQSSICSTLRPSVTKSSTGTISGGSAMMRIFPSSVATSFENAFSRSFVSALATIESKPLTCRFSAAPAAFSSRSQDCTFSASSESYHASRTDCSAECSIRSRYPRPAATRISRRSASLNPRWRPAISKLATSRFTSHSNGPGWVSSKSLMSNARRRSAEPNRPKFDRCASPHSWTVRPLFGSGGEVGCHQQRGAAVERERRDHHASVTHGDEVRHPRLGLLLQQRDRVGAVVGRRPLGLARSRRANPCRATEGASAFEVGRRRRRCDGGSDPHRS